MKVASVSHSVIALTQVSSSAAPAPHSTAENTSACVLVSSPLAVGRQAVRVMRVSICCSTRQLNAAAAAATSQMPAVAASVGTSGGQPGTARNMPITAQNTISCTTRGLVSA